MKCVAFSDLKPKIMLFKIPLILRERGIRTILFSVLKTDIKHYSKAFDEINCLWLDNLKPIGVLKNFIKNPKRFINFFHRLFTIKNLDAIITECPPYYLGSFFMRVFKNRCSRLYLPYDMYSTRIRRNSKGFSKTQAFWEKYNILNCDGFVHKGPVEELNLFPKSWVKGKKTFKFEVYPLKRFFTESEKKNKISFRDKKLHVVHIGGFKKGNFLYNSMIPDVKEVIKQKIHLHLYLNKSLFNNQDFKEATDEDSKLKEYLHIHDFVHPEKLSKEISKYDFGIVFSTPSKDSTPDIKKFATGNQTSVFIEAGIPTIIPDRKIEFMCSPLKENNIGIVVDNIKEIKKEIEKFDYKKGVINIKKYRKENCIERKINGLIKFINELNDK